LQLVIPFIWNTRDVSVMAHKGRTKTHMQKIEETRDYTSDHPSGRLPKTASADWAKAFDAYVAWAKGGPNPGVKGTEVAFSTAAINGTFTVNRDWINIKLPPGSSYKDIEAFLDDAIAYADEVSPEG
jgi:hypothetical protein